MYTLEHYLSLTVFQSVHHPYCCFITMRADEAAVGVVCRLEHSQKEIVLKRGVSYLPGTQSERDSASECTWSSIYTTEYNRTRGTIVLVSKQRECKRQ